MRCGNRARVLRPGGSLIATCDNDGRLNRLLDPKLNPRLGGARRALKAMLRRLGVRIPDRPSVVVVRRHSVEEFDRILATAGIERVAGRTFGFGPFTLLGRVIVRGSRGVRLHERLQTLADLGVAGLRTTGTQYIVLGRKGGERVGGGR